MKEFQNVPTLGSYTIYIVHIGSCEFVMASLNRGFGAVHISVGSGCGSGWASRLRLQFRNRIKFPDGFGSSFAHRCIEQHLRLRKKMFQRLRLQLRAKCAFGQRYIFVVAWLRPWATNSRSEAIKFKWRVFSYWSVSEPVEWQSDHVNFCVWHVAHFIDPCLRHRIPAKKAKLFVNVSGLLFLHAF